MRKIVIFVASVGAALGVVALILRLPPLTSGGGSTRLPGVSAADLQEAVAAERAFCNASDMAVDCACFAGKAGIVRSAAGPKINGAFYADQKDLARSQAAESC